MKNKVKFKDLELMELYLIAGQKCPKTKDGTPVVPSVDVVYHYDFLDENGEPVPLHFNDYNNKWTSPLHDSGKKIEECFSSIKLVRKHMKNRS